MVAGLLDALPKNSLRRIDVEPHAAEGNGKACGRRSFLLATLWDGLACIKVDRFVEMVHPVNLRKGSRSFRQ